MQLTRNDVQKVATLARLDFSEAELELFTTQLGNIVDFVEQLGEVDTTGVEPLAHPLEIHSVLRPDERRAGLSREAALSNSPSHDDACFLVPAVMARKS
jgi:aspartyl-tRNA(Asn)/glutamyl-tRNA(Gln) amidotransferase subunit C